MSTAMYNNQVQNLVLTIMSDVETKQSKKGNSYHKFRGQISKKLEDSTWVNQTFFVTAFGEIPANLQKKDRVTVDGTLSVAGYTDKVTGEMKTILEITANKVFEYVYKAEPNLPSTEITNTGGFDDVVPF